MKYDPIFRYGAKDRRLFKIQKGYIGYVNDHHIIPKKFRPHPIITETEFDINPRFNLLIMPTPDGV